MDLTHWHITWVQYAAGVGVLVGVLCVGLIVQHGSRLRAAWNRLRGKSSGPDELAILSALLSQLTALPPGRTLLSTILQFVAGQANTDGASLLVRSREQPRYLLREVIGTRPGSFQVGDISGFLTWLQQTRRTVTRRELVEDPVCAEIKTSGLQYCVQFHAEACVPCFLGGELVALINLGPRSEGNLYPKNLCRMLDRLAVECALAIQNDSLSAAVAQYRVELVKLAELKSSILANISHELRTPLTSVIGLSEHLIEQGPVLNPDESRQFLGMIHDSGKRLLRTVNALLDLARLESDRDGLEVRRINLNKLMEEVRAALRPGEGTDVDIRIGADMPSVYGDVTWVRCLLQHLLDNAIKYTPKGKVWVEAERSGDMLQIAVHDTGIGIEKAQHEAVFNGFVQADGGMARTHEGVGIGLAISRRVVELHGGRIWLKSQPGTGSHVFFTLPIKPSAKL